MSRRHPTKHQIISTDTLLLVWKLGGPADSDLMSFGHDSHSQIEGHSPGIEQSARQALTEQFEPRLSCWTSEYWQRLGVQVDGPAAAASTEGGEGIMPSS